MPKLKLTEDKRILEAKNAIESRRLIMQNSGYHNYVERLATWDKMWMRAMVRRNSPWPHASDYNTPLVFSKVEDVHAVLMSFFGTPNFFTVVASGGSAEQSELRRRAQLRTDYLRWSLMNEANYVSAIDTWLHDGLQNGTGFLYLPFVRQVRKMRSELFFEAPKDVELTDRQIIQEAIGSAMVKGPTAESHKEFGTAYKITFWDDDGEKKPGLAFVDRDHPMRPDGVPVVIVERDVVVYNAPKPTNVMASDMIIPADAVDLQSAREFHVRRYMSYDEIARHVQAGIFNSVSTKELEELKKISEMQTGGLPHSEMDRPDEHMDFQLESEKLQSRGRDIEVFFQYVFEDIDGDGFEESIVRAYTEAKRPLLLMRHRIEYLYPHGLRPYIDWHLYPISGRYYSMGIPEALEHDQREANAFYQARSDVLEITTKPSGMIDPMSGLAPTDIRFRPGTLVKARDPQHAFHPFIFPNDPTSLLREQSGIEGQAERAVGSTDMGLGRGPQRPNQPRTLGGTAIVVRQQQLRTDVYLKRAAYGTRGGRGGVVEFLHQYMALSVALMPAEKEFRALGTDEVRKIQRADMQGRFDFTIDLGDDVNNPQIRMQNSIMRYQQSAANPLIMQNPQAFWHITVDMLEATGMRNASRVLPPPMGDTHPPMTQENEIAVMSKGVYIEPLMSDNHDEHISVIQQFISDPMMLAAQFTSSEMPLLEKHASTHMQMKMRLATQSANAIPQMGQQAAGGPPSFEEMRGGNSAGAGFSGQPGMIPGVETGGM